MGFNSGDSSDGMMSFGGHLEVLRRMLFRIIAAVMVLAVVIFCFKDNYFRCGFPQY